MWVHWCVCVSVYLVCVQEWVHKCVYQIFSLCFCELRKKENWTERKLLLKNAEKLKNWVNKEGMETWVGTVQVFHTCFQGNALFLVIIEICLIDMRQFSYETLTINVIIWFILTSSAKLAGEIWFEDLQCGIYLFLLTKAIILLLLKRNKQLTRTQKSKTKFSSEMYRFVFIGQRIQHHLI